MEIADRGAMRWRSWRWRAVLPAIGLTLLATAASLYVWTPSRYITVMSTILPNPGAGVTMDTAFVDLQYVLLKVSCWENGVNVYIKNSCDLFADPMLYSPLWLRIEFLALDRSWKAPLGIGAGVLFCLSLAVLVPSPRWRDQLIIGLASFSPVSVYAVERGNIDILIYLLSIAAAIVIATKPRTRFVGYALLLCGGLLKFYPVAALVVLMRERLRVCFAIAAVSAAVIAGFAELYYSELMAALRNIWSGGPFSNYIGATILSSGIKHGALQPIFSLFVERGWSVNPRKSLILAYGALVLLMLSVCAFMVWIARSREYKDSVAALPPKYGMLLQIGAALMVGCFFTGHSVGYRGIMLLLALPGIVLLSRREASLRKISRLTVVLILLVMFRIPITGLLVAHNLRVQNSALAAFIWITFELAWWWIVSFLLAVLTSSIFKSKALLEARALVQLVWQRPNQQLPATGGKLAGVVSDTGTDSVTADRQASS